MRTAPGDLFRPLSIDFGELSDNLQSAAFSSALLLYVW
jgi:hypothetical protein